MADSTNVLKLIIDGDDQTKKAFKSLNNSINKTEKATKKTTKGFLESSKAGIGLKAITPITIGLTAGLLGLAAGLNYTVDAASALQETTQKFNVTFSDVREEADKLARNLQANFGLSLRASKDLLAGTGDLLSGFGFTQQKALDLADAAAKLGTDLASFSNFAGGAEGATQAITAAMLGETERMKALGVIIRQTDIKNLALAKGLKLVNGEVSKQDKAMLTLEIAATQSKNAIGDFARSSDSYANITRKASGNTEDLAALMGEKLLPVAGLAITAFNKVAGAILNYSNNAKKAAKQSEEMINNRVGVINSLFKEGKATKELEEEYDQLLKLQTRFGGANQQKIKFFQGEQEVDTAGNKIVEKAKEVQEKVAIISNDTLEKNLKQLQKEVDALETKAQKEKDLANEIAVFNASVRDDEDKNNTEAALRVSERERKRLEDNRSNMQIMLDDWRNYSLLVEQMQMNMVQSIQNNLSSLLTSITDTSRTGGEKWAAFGASMVNTFANSISQMVTKWIIGQLTMSAASKAAGSAEIAKNAAVAGSGAAASQASIPIIGPILAIGAMAAMFAAVLSMKSKGGFQTPEGGSRTIPGSPNEAVMFMGHGGEKVGRDGGSGLTINFNSAVFNANETAEAISDMLIEHNLVTGKSIS